MTITGTDTGLAHRELATAPSTGRAWWFLGTLAVLRNPEGAPRTPVVMELTVPPGGSPPRHVHEQLDDSFFLLDGEVVVRCGEETVVVHPGGYAVMPHGVEHTFRVTSRRPARMLLVHADDSFLRFVEAVGTPTDEHRLPPAGAESPDFDMVARLSGAHGAPMVGPSLEEDEARAFLADDDRTAIGAVHHLSLQVRDLAASERWYADALGLVRVEGEIAADGSGHLVLLQPEAGWLVTLMAAPEAGVEHVAFGCEDRAMLLRWQAALAGRGITPGSITDAPYGSGFVLRDPDGIEVELFAPAPVPG